MTFSGETPHPRLLNCGFFRVIFWIKAPSPTLICLFSPYDMMSGLWMVDVFDVFSKHITSHSLHHNSRYTRLVSSYDLDVESLSQCGS